MKRLLVLALSLALGITATACTDATGPGGALAGNYSLLTVNGVAPPYAVENSATLYSEVVQATIVLEANGNYTGVTRFRDTYPGQQPVLVDETTIGYWTLSGNQLALTEQGFPNAPNYGTVSGNRITISDFGFTLVYSK